MEIPNPEKYLYLTPAGDFKNRRAFLVSEFVKGINQEREGTKYNKVTEKRIAIRINKNPWLAKSDAETEFVLNECRRRGNFKYFFFITK